jgi:hypothetical protein
LDDSQGNRFADLLLKDKKLATEASVVTSLPFAV